MGCGSTQDSMSDYSYSKKPNRYKRIIPLSFIGNHTNSIHRKKSERDDQLKKKKSTGVSSSDSKSKRLSVKDVHEKKQKGKRPQKSNEPDSIQTKLSDDTIKQTPNKDNNKKGTISIDVRKFIKENKGDITERYTVNKILGKGAYGEVSLIIDKVTGNKRAMKTISKQNYYGANNLSINTEIQMLKNLDHPNILKIYEFYQDDENYYLVTEYCSGGELYDRIISMKNFSERKAADLMRQILSAVTYCHDRKIVHRDIKPENLLFESADEDANIKVIDFGTSMLFQETKMSQKLGTVFV